MEQNFILFDEAECRTNLLPFTYLRPVADIRVGILTITQKWGHYLAGEYSFLTEPYLGIKHKPFFGEENIYINGGVCPNEDLARAISSLDEGEALVSGGVCIALKSIERLYTDKTLAAAFDEAPKQEYATAFNYIFHPWDIFHLNKAEIIADFKKLTNGRVSQPVNDPHTIVYGAENLFIEEGAKIRAAIINAEAGPVYIGKNAVVHEGSIISGAFALCEGAHVNMGGKMKGDTTIGPFCKVGGEISNSVFFAYSNKGHDGFLGNSVIGEWCNLGADTNTSNLKNNYSPVSVWDYTTGEFKNTGLVFCGLLMGDHSKSGINTMFNTGTVVGVAANVFGAGFPKKFIPSFSWGGAEGFETFNLDKSYDVAKKMMERRNIKLTEEDCLLLEKVFYISKPYRDRFH